jgi:uncharacterized protein
MTLATHGPLGLWAAALFYASDQFDFYFLSAGHTRHAQNIAASPQTAATIQEDYRDWPAIRGIQLEGETVLLTDAAREAAIALYQQKYPFVADDPALQAALQRVNWYRLRPTALYYLDNSRGFGHRDQIV